MSGVKSRAYAIAAMAALSTIVAGCKRRPIDGTACAIGTIGRKPWCDHACWRFACGSGYRRTGSPGLLPLLAKVGWRRSGWMVALTPACSSTTRTSKLCTDAILFERHQRSDRFEGRRLGSASTDVSYGVYDVHNADGSRQVGSYHYGNITLRLCPPAM